MNPIWVTILVAVIASVLSFFGTLGAQSVGHRQSLRREERGREAERLERRRRERRDVCVAFLGAAKTAGAVLRSSVTASEVDVALRALHEAAEYLDLEAPELADGPLVAVLSAAERLQGVAARNPATSAVVLDAYAEFEQATSHLRGLMRVDLGTHARS